MDEATLGWIRRTAAVCVVVMIALIVAVALAWGPTVLYLAAPFALGSLVLIGLRLWARSVDGLPESLPRDRWFSDYWERDRR